MLIQQAFLIKKFFVERPSNILRANSFLNSFLAINYLLKHISRFLNIKCCQVRQKTLDSVIYKGYIIYMLYIICCIFI